MPSILQLVEIDQTGDSYHRMRWPAHFLAQANPAWSVVNLSAYAAQRYHLAERADLLVLFQSMDLDLLPIIRQRNQRGLKTLVEYNDNFYQASPWSPVASAWSSPLLWQRYESFMYAADGVIVTGKALENVFRETGFDGKIHILENHLPEKPRPFEQLCAKRGENLSIGWAGSLGHIADLIAVAPILRRLLQQHTKLKLHIMGNKSIPDILHVPAEQLNFTEWGEMHLYFRFWQEVTLGIIPLLDTPYNCGRSDIKAVEIAGNGCCPLIPDLAPYQDFLAATQLTPYKDIADLAQRITNYLSDPASMRRDAERAYKYVSEHRIHCVRKEREQLYSSLLPQSSSQDWPYSVGYHELVAGNRSPAPLEQCEQNIRQLVRNNQITQALPILQSERKRVPESADLAILEIQLLRLSKNYQAALNLCIEQAKYFIRDVRFLILLSEMAMPEERADLWRAILTDNPPIVLQGFLRELSQALAKQINQSPDLIVIEDLALQFLANQADLRQALADTHWRAGNLARANLHYTWLAEHASIARANKEFFDGASAGYFDAWKEASGAL